MPEDEALEWLEAWAEIRDPKRRAKAKTYVVRRKGQSRRTGIQDDPLQKGR